MFKWLKVSTMMWITTMCILLGVIAGEVIAQSAPVTLVLQYRGGGLRTEAILALITEFEAENPDIRVEFLPAPSGFQDRTLVSWAAGVGPDVTEIFGDWGTSYARSGVLMDLRPYVERDMPLEDQQDFWPVAWEASHVTAGPYQGAQYMLPRYMITTVYYYNDDHFAQAGLVSPNALDRTGDWTYGTMREVAKKLALYDGDRLTRYGFSTNTQDYRRLAVWARAFGGDFFNLEDPREFWGTRDEAVEAMSFLQDMIHEDGTTHPRFIRGTFFSGGVSMVEEGNHSVLDQFERNIAGAFEWDLAPSPVGVNGRKSYSADNGWAIWRDTRHPEEAWRLVKFLSSKRGQEIVAQHEGLAPVRRSAMPFYQQLATHLNLGVLFTNMADVSPPTTTLLLGDVSRIATTLNEALTTAIVNNEKPWRVVAEEIKPIIEALARE